MDDILVRPRYPRHSVPVKRRRKAHKEEDKFVEKITRQLFASILILVVAVGVKSVNSPVTNFLSDRIREIVVKNIEMKSLYEKIDNFFDGLKKDNGANAVIDEEDGSAIPVNAGVYRPEENTGGGTDTGNKAAEGDVEILESTSDDVAEIREKYTFIAPVDGVLSSPFGERTDPFTQEIKLHKGIDIEAEKGSPVRAALEGKVIEAGSERSYGNYIKIQHSDGIVTLYAHCSKLIAREGQEVKQGDIIAEVGNTGASVGSHLHFEVWKDGKVIDPLNFISIASE